jgi:hypothetical protein
MRLFKTIILILVAILSSALYWKLGQGAGFLLLLLAVSLAIIGEGHRLWWLLVFPLLCCALAAALYGMLAWIPQGMEFPKLLMLFTLVTVLPSGVLWFAANFAKLRSRLNGKTP